MKQLAQSVFNDLNLDYAVTLVSSGESGSCEIVMWDRPHDSYFSLKLRLPPDAPVETLEADIREQLEERVASGNHQTDRRPTRRHQTSRVIAS